MRGQMLLSARMVRLFRTLRFKPGETAAGELPADFRAPASDIRGWIDKLCEPKTFFVFFLLWILSAASLVPALLNTVLPLDTVEAVIWGQDFSAGNCKHPPLSGWLAGITVRIFNGSDWPIYLLSQIMVVIGLIYVYRLAKEFFSDDTRSVTAALLVYFVMNYSFHSSKYNVNVLSLAFWPMTAYYFLTALRSNRMSQWILLGLAAGLNLLSKYFAGVELLALFLYMLTDRTARRRFLSPGPYLAGAVCFLTMLPHLIWLYQWDFLPFTYISNNVAAKKEPFYYPVELFFTLFSLMIPSALTLWITQFPIPFRLHNAEWKQKLIPVQRQAAVYCGFLLLTPIVFMTLLACFVPRIKANWCWPVYFVVGILLLAFMRPDGIRRWKFFLVAVMGFAVCVQVGDVIYWMSKTRQYGHFPARQFASDARAWYRGKTGREIPFLLGSMWFSGVVSHYTDGHPKVLIWNDPHDRARYRDAVAANGAMVVFEKRQMKAFLQSVGRSGVTFETFTFPYRAPWGRPSDETVCFAVLPPGPVLKDIPESAD